MASSQTIISDQQLASCSTEELLSHVKSEPESSSSECSTSGSETESEDEKNHEDTKNNVKSPDVQVKSSESDPFISMLNVAFKNQANTDFVFR